MSIGMTYEQFWYGTPFLAKMFEKAHLIKRKRENYMLWLQGVYIYDALNSSLSYALGSKNSKHIDYPKKPYDVFEKTKEEKELEKEEAKQKIIAELMSW